jgi:hypothetical protein
MDGLNRLNFFSNSIFRILDQFSSVFTMFQITCASYKWMVTVDLPKGPN